MTERKVGRAQELRQKFEERYQDLIPDFREIFLRKQEWLRNGPWRNAYDQWRKEGIEPNDSIWLADFQKCRAWNECNRRVWGLYESDYRTWRIVYALVVPQLQRLDDLILFERKHPPRPATKKQTLQAIESVNKAISDERLNAMWEGIRPEGEDWGDLTVNHQRIIKLEQQKGDLENLLSTFFDII